MLNPSILNALRKATDLAIKIDPTVVELVPHKRTRKPGGVFDYVPQSPRAPQKFLVEPVGSTLTGITGTSGGLTEADGGGAKVHSWSYNLTGRYDSQMDIGDTWKDGETIYRVVSIQPENGYEKVGVITALGKDPSYGN